MIGPAMVMGLLLVGMDGPRDRATESAADRITLKDGSIVRGLVTTSTPGPRGSVEFLVRRAWADKILNEHLRRWDRATAAAAQLAAGQRRKRLEAWRRERAAGAGAGDRIVLWIDRELARSAAGKSEPSILVPVRLPRHEIRDMARSPAGAERLLRLAWLCKLPEPESMPVAELKDALEGRGYAVDAAAQTPPAALDRLLPPAPEPDVVWLGRRAATELSLDPDLRFLRFQDTVIPDAGAGQLTSVMGLSTAVSELKRLLDPDQGQRTDPLAEKLKAVAARGRVGAQVTRLEIQPDLSGVTVESTLWVRGGERWISFGSRTATVRPDDLEREAGKNLEDDPQIQSAFKIVEMLGLGAIPADVKGRSLRIGAATEKALGMARSAFNQDLEALALPVLEPARDDPAPAPKVDERRPR
jgi:hypothetical protein